LGVFGVPCAHHWGNNGQVGWGCGKQTPGKERFLYVLGVKKEGKVKNQPENGKVLGG